MAEMTSPVDCTLGKSERICSKNTVDALLRGGHSHSLSAFPLRVVYKVVESQGDVPCQMLVSVPKKCFKRAVKRNRVKRQLRQAYRTNKHVIIEAASALEGKTLVMAFIWLDAKLHDSARIDARMLNLMERLREKLWEKS